MIDPQTLFLFGVASFALCASPGPDIILIAARSVAQGRMAGFITHLGVSAGSFIHALMLALGLSQLFLAVPFAYDLVRYLGAAYLAYLAWQVLTGGDEANSEHKATKNLSMFVIFRQGLLSNVLNPKVALFFLALFPQFVEPANGAVALQIMMLAVVLNLVGLIVNGTVVLLAGSMRQVARKAGIFARLSRYFLGVVFAGLAARLLLDDAR